MWEKENWPMAYDDQGFSMQLFEIGKFVESPPQKNKGKKKVQKLVVNEFT